MTSSTGGEPPGNWLAIASALTGSRAAKHHRLGNAQGARGDFLCLVKIGILQLMAQALGDLAQLLLHQFASVEAAARGRISMGVNSPSCRKSMRPSRASSRDAAKAEAVAVRR